VVQLFSKILEIFSEVSEGWYFVSQHNPLAMFDTKEVSQRQKRSGP